QSYFFKYLLALIGSVSALVLAGNLIMFLGMWILTSYNLHRLLLFYDNRPNARAAAIKKQFIARKPGP
ncbi:MAG: hypothetical protein D3907_04125, partial [Candidatus Electrothrix sp. AUS3]|nr:hypothetical protein [Candidatus Electrothrix gigas]